MLTSKACILRKLKQDNRYNVQIFKNFDKSIEVFKTVFETFAFNFYF